MASASRTASGPSRSRALYRQEAERCLRLVVFGEVVEADGPGAEVEGGGAQDHVEGDPGRQYVVEPPVVDHRYLQARRYFRQ